jgi:hypothetical protein
MKQRVFTALAVVLAVGLTWFGYAAWRASRNLVTLDVREAPLRVVLHLIEHQTWETILAHKDVDGKVTLKVKNAPLEEVLNILADQTSSRWTAVYPLYKSSRSLTSLQMVLQGESDPMETCWTNLQTRPFGFRGGLFADNLRNENNLINLNLQNKDLSIATLALARFSRAQIVPEDGTEGTVQLTLRQATMDDAVRKLSKQINRRWTEYYAFQPGGFGFGRGGRQMAGVGGDTNAPPTNGPPPWDGPPPEVRERMQKQFEAQLETMTPEDKQKALEEQQRREQMFAEMRNLTPEQRRERFAQMANDPQRQQQMQNRMMSGLKNTTPQQRVERDQRMIEMRKRFEQRSGQQTRP